MRTKTQIAILAGLVLIFTSCDSNKGKIKDTAKEFISAVNEKDNVTINQLYPERKDYKNLQVTPSITSDGIEVSYNEEDSIYTAKLNDKQSLLFKFDENGTPAICDSYGVLQLDSVTRELAAKIGAPVNKTSDLLNGRLFEDYGALLGFLDYKFPYATKGNIKVDLNGGRYSYGANRGQYYCEIENTFQNVGDVLINGEDYDILIEFFQRSNSEHISADTQPGQTLAPNGTGVIRINKPNLYRLAQNHNLYWNITPTFKNSSRSAMFDKYGKFTGNEFDEFMEEQVKIQMYQPTGEEGEEGEEFFEEHFDE